MHSNDERPTYLDLRAAIGARRTADPSLRGVSAATRDAVRERAERCGVAEESIVALALEALFAEYDSDAELARAIRLDAVASRRGGRARYAAER